MGEETSIDLAEYFKDIKNLEKASQEELQKVQDIGPIVAESIFEWFNKKSNKDFLRKLLKAIKVTSYKLQVTKLQGKTFVFTGELKSLSRDEAKRRVREMGGNVSESISKKIDYVVVGDNPGSKCEKAKELGLKIINEKEFLQI